MQKILSFFRPSPESNVVGATAESMPSTRMKVCFFQLQILSEFYSGPACFAGNFLRTIDPNCPVPQGLEGGNGRGPLYQCIFDADKKEKLLKAIEQSSQHVIVGSFGRGEVDRAFYRPDCYVQWNFGADPSISISPY